MNSVVSFAQFVAMGFFKKLRIFLSGRGKKNRPAPDTSGEIIKHLVLTVYFLPISTFVVADGD